MKLVNLTAYWPVLLGLLLGGGAGALLGYVGQCTSGLCPLTATWWRGMIFGAFLGAFFATSFTRPARPEAHIAPTQATDHSVSPLGESAPR